MIKVELLRVEGRDLFCPFFYCDACNERIARNADGNYLWYYGVKSAPIQAVYIAHKGDCTRRLDKAHAIDGVLAMCWELRDLPAELAANGAKGEGKRT
jgi:hypothetical protein